MQLILLCHLQLQFGHKCLNEVGKRYKIDFRVLLDCKVQQTNGTLTTSLINIEDDTTRTLAAISYVSNVRNRMELKLALETTKSELKHTRA